MLPPAGAIIVGPCPECQGLVVVFCGQVLPLKKDIMVDGSTKEKRQHIMTVLTGFLKDRVGQIVAEDDDVRDARDEIPPKPQHPVVNEKPATPFEQKREANAADKKTCRPEHLAEPIGHEDVRRFVINDLKKLDDPEQFKKIFG
jgi:hypothetical protein